MPENDDRERAGLLTRVPLLAVLALLLAGTVPGLPSSTSAAWAASDLRLPPRYPALPPSVMDAAAGSGGVLAYGLRGASGAATASYVVIPGQARPRRFDAMTVAGIAGPHVMFHTGVSSMSPVKLLDTSTGAVRDLPVDATHAPSVPLPDGGWVGIDQSGDSMLLVRHAADGGATGTIHVGRDWPHALRADAKGALWQTPTGTGIGSVLHYGTWATGTSTELWRGQAVVDSVLTPSYLLYGRSEPSGFSIVRRSRSSLGVVSTRSIAGQLRGIAATDSATAWTTFEGTTSGTMSVWTSTESAPSRHVRAAAGLPDYQRPFVLGSRFGVVAGATSRTRGLYAVDVGATSLGAALTLVGPRAPFGITAGPGRVVFLEPTAHASGYTAVEQGVDITADSAAVRGGERLLSGGASFPAAELSGGSLATTQAAGSQIDVVVQDHTVEIARVRSDGYLGGFSGNRLAIAQTAPAGSVSRYRTRVVDISDTGVAERSFDGTGDVDGEQVATFSDDGSVALHDLATGRSTPLRAAGPGPAGAFSRRIQIADGVVAWTWLDADGAVETVARQVAAGPMSLVGSPADVTISGRHEQVRVAGGRIAWIDADDREVHVRDVASGADTVVGKETAQASGNGLLALGPDFVAWVDDDAYTVVHPLGAPAGPAELISTAAPSRFSPRTGLRIRGEADQAIDSVQLTVTDSTGAVVAQQTTSAADGGLRPGWNARLSDGRPAPAGAYQWQVTALDGARPVLGGPDAPVTGTAVLDTTAPSLNASTPVAASDTSTTPAFRVSWSGNDPSAVYDVSVTKRGRQPDGSRTFGPLRVWQRGRATGSAVYTGSGVPYPAPPGSLLRFVITARDAAGNATSTTRDVLVPYDDGAAPQQYAGWTSGSSTGSYGGRQRSTTGRATMTLRTSTNRVLVVGARCRSCGRFSVSVDGRVVRSVDTYGAGSQRQRLLDLRLTGAPTVHTIVLRALATAGRPRVVVDAVGLVA